MLKRFLLGSLIISRMGAQALYDFTPVTTNGTFTGSGSAAQNFVIEGRLKADSNGTGFNDYLSGPSLYARVTATPYLTVGMNLETGGNPNFAATIGTSYRIAFVHNYSTSQVTLVVWSDDCSAKLFSQTNIVGNVQAATIAGSWAFGHDHQSGFWRMYSGLTGSSNGGLSCPVDRPTTVGTIMDFPFETGTGTTPYLADRSGNQPNITVASPSYTLSATPGPSASIAWATNVPRPVARVGVAYTFTSSSFSSTWPGTGAPSSYSWSIPGSCTSGATNAATLTVTCSSAGNGTVGLTVTDAAMSTASASTTLGIVQTDANGCVTMPNANFGYALNYGKCLPVLGSTGYPWFESASVGDAALISTAIQAPVHTTAGSGTVTIPCSSINSCPSGHITALGTTVNGVYYGGVAIQGSGAIFTAADVNNYIEITWTPPGDTTNSGKLVVYVTAVDTVANVAISTFYDLAEPASSLSSAMSWARLSPGSGSCSGITASTSGGQVTGLSFSGCTGFLYYAAAWPTVTVSGGSGCSIQVQVHGPADTPNTAIWGTIDNTSQIGGGTGIPCGTGFTGTPSATATARSDYEPYDIGLGAGTYNYYEALLGIGRLAYMTNLPEFINAWHAACSNSWRWSSDSGYRTHADVRQSGWSTLIACATDPNWTQPISSASMFTLIGGMVAGEFASYNPSTDVKTGALDGREEGSGIRASALLAKLGNSYVGGLGTTWAAYVANQLHHRWYAGTGTVYQYGDASALYVPEDYFGQINANYVAAGYPPGSSNFGTAPWRSDGLPIQAMLVVKDAMTANGYTTESTFASNAIVGFATYVKNYGTSQDWGAFYDTGYSSNPYVAVWNNLAVNGGANRQSGTVSASGTTVTGVGTTFTRSLPAGSQMQINGTNYTVASTSSDTALTLTSSAGTVASTSNFGNTCAMTATHGSTTVTGSSGCKFLTMFGGGNAYVGILSSDCGTTNYPNCTAEDGRVYAITPNTDTIATLNTGLVGCNNTCSTSGTGGGTGTTWTGTSFAYAPQANSNCGASLAPFCNPDANSGRNLSQDICAGYIWAWEVSGIASWKNTGLQCFNKQYGGPAGGPGTTGGPSGYSVDANLGLIKLTTSGGGTSVVGIGTHFLSQTAVGHTLVVADNDGNTWANYPGLNPTYYSVTVATLTDDIHLTITSPWTHTNMATGTGLFYDATDPQWLGADGGTGILASALYPCANTLTPCQAGVSDFDSKKSKSFGMGWGLGNAPIGIGEVVGSGAAVTSRMFGGVNLFGSGSMQ